MSSILKALKKLEDENNARTPDSLRINAEILRGGDSPRFSTLGIVVVAALLFLCGAVATYLLMKPGDNKLAAISSPVPVERTVPDAIVPAAPVPPSPQTTPVDTLQQVPSAALPQQPRLVEKSKRNPAASPVSTVKPARNKPLLQLNIAKRALSPAKMHQPEQPEIPILSARPVVRINGIAFQDGSDSVAVINGVPLSRGAVIEGVKVEEIQRDRVLFSYGEEKFEVYLGKSNQ